MGGKCFIELVIPYIMQIFDIHKEAEFTNKQRLVFWINFRLISVKSSGADKVGSLFAQPGSWQ